MTELPRGTNSPSDKEVRSDKLSKMDEVTESIATLFQGYESLLEKQPMHIGSIAVCM